MSNAYIARLNHTREGVYNEAKRLLDAAIEQRRELTAEEDRTYADLNQHLEALDASITAATEAESRQREVEATFGSLLARPIENGHAEARTWLPGLAEYRELQAEQRAVGTTGAFIPVGYSQQYFDLLRKRTAVLAAGPQFIPVTGAGSLKVPTVTAAASIGGYAENAAITATDPGLGSITLDPKKFGAMTLVAREALEDSAPQVREVVANSLIADTAVKLDEQLVTGDGTGQNLLGLRNVSGVTAGASTGTNGGSLSFGFLADTLGASEAANTDPDRLAWIMHARTWASVRKLVDSQSRPLVAVDPTLGVRPTLFGKPVFLSNSLSITETKGSSSDCSSILLADMSQVVVAVAREVELLVSEDYAFNTDQIAVKVTARYDIGVPQPTSLVVTSGVRV